LILKNSIFILSSTILPFLKTKALEEGRNNPNGPIGEFLTKLNFTYEKRKPKFRNLNKKYLQRNKEINE
jgi:hypothetical protein